MVLDFEVSVPGWPAVTVSDVKMRYHLLVFAYGFFQELFLCVHVETVEKVMEHTDELEQVNVSPWEEWWGGYVPAFDKQKQEARLEEISGYC